MGYHNILQKQPQTLLSSVFNEYLTLTFEKNHIKYLCVDEVDELEGLHFLKTLRNKMVNGTAHESPPPPPPPPPPKGGPVEK